MFFLHASQDALVLKNRVLMTKEMTSEFNLIQKYFSKPSPQADLGVGDDAALISVGAGMQLAISSDMLVAGTHFFHDAAPYAIGWKALAVNVSDMAAMGAQARWATLAIALPQILPAPFQGEDQDGGAPHVTPTPALPLKEGGGVNEAWLAEFSRGFFACAAQFGVDLIGGDTTRGPLNISVTIMGEVPIGAALRRDGTQVGDEVWVSGQLGSAALGLVHLQGKIKLGDELATCLNALHTPTPQAALGLALRGIATSCIDISDGLLADLGHILKASNCGARIDLEKIPCIDILKNKLENPHFQAYMLAGGDDYELCFTAPQSKHEQINALSKQLNVPISWIGSTRIDIGLQADYQNNQLTLLEQGFDHFKA
jgi:thiamine-monophosphate kinase